MDRLVLLPQQRQRHPLGAQLAVHLTPPRHRTRLPPRRRRRKQPTLQPRIIQRVRQRPTQTLRLGAADAPPHRRRRHLQAAGDHPQTHPRGVVQPQDLSNLTHGQPPVRHRRTLLQNLGGSYGNRLSRVAQLQGSDPLHLSGASRKSDHLPTGIADHFAPDSVITFDRNTHTSDGARSTPNRLRRFSRRARAVQPHEICPFGQYSCGLRLGQNYCGFLSTRPQLAVFEDMSVPPTRFTCPRHGFSPVFRRVGVGEVGIRCHLPLVEGTGGYAPWSAPGSSRSRGCPRRFWHTVLVSPVLVLISPVQRLCATARILAVWPVFLSIPGSTTAACCS